MAQHFTQGVTDYAAADPQLDFCNKLEDFLVNTVGWVCVVGTGTTNMRFSSVGESGTRTMLFIHVWAAGNFIYGEVSDDAIPTHETNEGGLLIVFAQGLIQHRYWFTADLDCVIMVVPYLAVDRVLYLGLLEPVATPVNETYFSVASDDDMQAYSILRHSTGVWDVDIPIGLLDEYDNFHTSRLTGEFAIVPLYGYIQNIIAGQFKYMGASAATNGIQPHDVIESTYPGATSEWTVFANASFFFLVQTAGVAPGDLADGAGFVFSTGAAGTRAALMNAYLLHMQATGWTLEGSPGIWTTDWLHSSVGEDGTSSLFIHFGWNAPQWLQIAVWEDDIPTHATTYAYHMLQDPGMFPVTYHFSGDADCVGMAVSISPVAQAWPLWAGKCVPLYPGAAAGESQYTLASTSQSIPRPYVLRTHEGTWGSAGTNWTGTPLVVNSSPNLYDGTTYVLFPWTMGAPIIGAAARQNPAGVMKYLFEIDGAPLAHLDTITVGAEVYTVFWGNPGYWALRSV
jgi:hypothetical protein